MPNKLTILVVDDNRTNLALMDMLIRKLPNVSTQLQTDPQAVLAERDRMAYDLAVIACRLPGFDGVELARSLRAEPQLRDKPILLAADAPDAATWSRASEAGIAEVLGKPINPVEFRARILELANPHARPAAELSPWDDATAAMPEMSASEEEYLSSLVRIAGYRDRETPLHSQRVARFCAILAHNLGLPEAFCRDIRHAAPLHDVGKAGLSDAVLRKSGLLSAEERRDMEEHTRIGHAMLKDSRSRVLRMAAEIAFTHHERWDGTGYPQRLRGEQIPLAGRITAVADVFDALTSVRSYKTAWSIGNAFTYLHDKAGEQFDPACVAAFASGRDEIAEVMRAMPDPEDDAADAA